MQFQRDVLRVFALVAAPLTVHCTSAPQGPSTPIEQSLDLSLEGATGMVDRVNVKGAYITGSLYVWQQPGGTFAAHLDGYVVYPGGATDYAFDYGTVESIVYDEYRIYLFVTLPEGDIELDARYIPPNTDGDFFDAYDLEGMLAVTSMGVTVDYPVGTGEDDASWSAYFPGGSFPTLPQ
jgi:hypothetical protein